MWEAQKVQENENTHNATRAEILKNKMVARGAPGVREVELGLNPGLKEYELMEKAKEEERQVELGLRFERVRAHGEGEGGGATVGARLALRLRPCIVVSRRVHFPTVVFLLAEETLGNAQLFRIFLGSRGGKGQAAEEQPSP